MRLIAYVTEHGFIAKITMPPAFLYVIKYVHNSNHLNQMRLILESQQKVTNSKITSSKIKINECITKYQK